jgi:Na+/H+ antiporter NhaC
LDSNFPLGWLCLIPPLLTIVLAIVSQRVVLSLLIGIASAVMLLLPAPGAQQAVLGTDFSWSGYVWHSLQRFTYSLAEEHLWHSLFNEDHLRVFAFTTLLGMQVALIHLAGGMRGIVAWAVPWARSRRGGQVLTWLLGLVIFIDDYANSLLLGSTMRPLTDRLKISREKLAYLVDSTAAPVSGLALVSTWVATEISTMQVGYIDAGIDIGSATFGIFIQTIPSRFYVLYTLFFVLLCALLCRDYGPMLTAEKKAQTDQADEFLAAQDVSQQVPPRALNAILPITVTVAVVIWLLIATGLQAMPPEEAFQSTLQGWGNVIGQGNSYVSLVYGALAGLVTILGLIVIQKNARTEQIQAALVDGFLHVLPAMVILWLAWTLSHLTGNEHMRTGQFIASKLTQLDLPAGWLPTLVFVLSSAIAFSTGTSWGTMAIVMPIVIPLTYGMLQQQLGSPPAPDHFVMLATIGSVLAGAIFGDHCSPISDTTILSSRSSGCDHIAHVRTQMPYALTVGLVSIVFGTLPAGFGVPGWLILVVGFTALVVILWSVGRSADEVAS